MLLIPPRYRQSLLHCFRTDVSSHQPVPVLLLPGSLLPPAAFFSLPPVQPLPRLFLPPLPLSALLPPPFWLLLPQFIPLQLLLPHSSDGLSLLPLPLQGQLLLQPSFSDAY